MFDLPTRRQLEIPALGEAVRANHLGLVAEEENIRFRWNYILPEIVYLM